MPLIDVCKTVRAYGTILVNMCMSMPGRKLSKNIEKLSSCLGDGVTYDIYFFLYTLLDCSELFCTKHIFFFS